MRVFEFSDDTRMRIAGIVEHAHANPFLPGSRMRAPLHDPVFAIDLGDYHCVYWHEPQSGRLCRHLAVTVPRGLPDPYHFYLLAPWFGFPVVKDPMNPPVDVVAAGMDLVRERINAEQIMVTISMPLVPDAV